MSSTGQCGCDHCTVCTPQPSCDDCGGPLHQGLSDEALHQDGRVLLIRHIPSLICPQCGSYYLSDSETFGLLAAHFERFLAGTAGCASIEFEESQIHA